MQVAVIVILQGLKAEVRHGTVHGSPAYRMIGGFAAEVDDGELYLDTGVCVAAVFGGFDVFVVNHGAKVII